MSDSSLTTSQRKDALQFLIHFLGDIHQPLHDEAISVGGNKIKVKFDGKTTNLHAIWDSNLPEKLIGGKTMAFAQRWAGNLTTAINSGMYASSASGWLAGMSVSDVPGSAMVWARDSNAFVCTDVMPGGTAVLANQELGSSYYSAVIGTVELQTAKGVSILVMRSRFLANKSSSGFQTRRMAQPACDGKYRDAVKLNSR